MNVYLLPSVSSYPDCVLLTSGISFFSVIKADSDEAHICYSSCSAYGLKCPRFCGGFGQAHYGSKGYHYAQRDLAFYGRGE
jgi:hypothetical protein